MSLSLWGAREASAFDWRQWDGDMVVFVHASGDTHALGAASSMALTLLMEHRDACRSAAAWCELLDAGEQGSDEQGSPASDILAFEQLLVGLEGIGVVRHEVP